MGCNEFVCFDDQELTEEDMFIQDFREKATVYRGYDLEAKLLTKSSHISSNVVKI
jgi:hypothetical protein